MSMQISNIVDAEKETRGYKRKKRARPFGIECHGPREYNKWENWGRSYMDEETRDKALKLFQNKYRDCGWRFRAKVNASPV